MTSQMIANSHPYNPTQQLQQQRCVGINQQNSLYGSNVISPMPQQPQRQQTHMLDLANPHTQDSSQLSQANLFDSAYDDATSSQANLNNLNPQQQPQQQQQQQTSDPINSHSTAKMINPASNKQHQMQDVSLYSPSSSTSLLYHVYDQINVPTSSGDNQAQQNHTNFKRSNTTTILNPANLFASTTMGTGANLPPPSQPQINQQFMNTNKTTIPQQELYSSGAQFHLNQPSFNTLHQQQQQHQQHNTTYGLDSHQLMLDTILRQQHAATTRHTNIQHHYHNRPLSSSGASSMSGHSMALTYGRQPRQFANGHLPPLPPINPSKSQNTLASVLQSNQTLNHLNSLAGHHHLTSATMDHQNRGPKKLSHHNQFPTSSSSTSSGADLTSRNWKRVQQRVQRFAYQYSTLLKCSMLLVLIAFSLMSVIKFTSLNSTSSQSNQYQLQLHNQIQSINPLLQNQQQPPSQVSSNMNPLVYPPTKLMDLDRWATQAKPEQAASNTEAATPPDVLTSKLLIGEFVILSQNYSNSPAQKSLLSENIVKLMDQVFLSTDVRRVYLRMQITNIRPHMPTGIVVDCNIVLSESIAYAAQQFGIALYDSLAKSNEKLANQPSFIIDKSSIRFNTVPDKDLAIVPPQLLSTAFPQQQQPQQPAIQDPSAPSQMPPSDGSLVKQTLGDLAVPSNLDTTQDQSAVVWSEWSQWSSCVDKNGMCDPTRLHSRLRKCVSQHTGEKVEVNECRQRFNMNDRDLEVSDCSQSCANSLGSGQGSQPQVQSDAPSPIQPHTAPSVLVAGDSTPGLMLQSAQQQQQQQRIKLQPSGSKANSQDPTALASNLNGSPNGGGGDFYSPPSVAAAVSQQPTQQSQDPQATVLIPTQDPSVVVSTIAPLNQQQQQMSCSNCTADEICLLLITQKVPFCAKIKDRQDESGCGGWCKAQDQLCQPAGHNAFKCTHNSDCLPDEWRCHDSQCIPASKRCDGHENCFDSSDERYCSA